MPPTVATLSALPIPEAVVTGTAVFSYDVLLVGPGDVAEMFLEGDLYLKSGVTVR